MAKWNVDHACGHTVTHQLYGKHSEREKRAEYLSRQSCGECFRIAKTEMLQEVTTTAELPAITDGSEKQNVWATDERAKAGLRFHKLLAEKIADERVSAALADKYPGSATLVACDIIQEKGNVPVEQIDMLRRCAAVFSSNTSARFWIDSRNMTTLKDFVLAMGKN